MTGLAPHPRRERVRRALRGLSSLLIVSGVLLLVDAGLTVVWQEPLSAIYARIQQERLAGELDDLAGPTPLEQRALAALDGSGRLAFQARSLARGAEDGQPLGRLTIDSIDLSVIFVEGTDTDSLRSGPGHYPDTPLPGAPGTVGIAGHRTTYGAPFRDLDRLRKRDEIEVAMPYGLFTYEVERKKIVPPTAVHVTRRVGHDRLVLTACHPLYSAAQRIVVFARLRKQEPRSGLI